MAFAYKNHGDFQAVGLDILATSQTPFTQQPLAMQLRRVNDLLIGVIPPPYDSSKFIGALQLNLKTNAIAEYSGQQDSTSGVYGSCDFITPNTFRLSNYGGQLSYFNFDPNLPTGVYKPSVTYSNPYPSTFNGFAFHAINYGNNGYWVARYTKSYPEDYELWSLDSTGASHYFGFLANNQDPFSSPSLLSCSPYFSNYRASLSNYYEYNNDGDSWETNIGKVGYPYVRLAVGKNNLSLLGNDSAYRCFNFGYAGVDSVFGTVTNGVYGFSYIRGVYCVGYNGPNIILLSENGDRIAIRASFPLTYTYITCIPMIDANGDIYIGASTTGGTAGNAFMLCKVNLGFALPSGFLGVNSIEGNFLKTNLVNLTHTISINGSFTA